MVLPCAVQCLLGSLDICFMKLFWCQAIKIKLVTAKVWPKGEPKSGSVLRRQKWSCKNKYIISAYDSGRDPFLGSRNGSKSGPAILPTKHCREMLRRMFLPLKCATRPIERKPPRKELRRTCLWRTVSDWISGAENCTVTRRSPAHWPVMSEGNRHVFNHLLYQILAWNFSSVRLDDTDLYLDWFVKVSKFLGV